MQLQFEESEWRKWRVFDEEKGLVWKEDTPQEIIDKYTKKEEVPISEWMRL